MNHIISCFIIIGVLFTHCKNQLETESYLPDITGSLGEVLVITPKSKWESEIGDSLKAILKQPVRALPQTEEMFDVIRMPPTDFNKALKHHRSIIIVRTSSTYEKPAFNIEKNLWAEPQIVLKIFAPNDADLKNVIIEKQNEIVEAIKMKEMQRLKQAHKIRSNEDGMRKLKKEHHVQLTLPSGYNIAKDTNNFIWIAHETGLTSRGVFVYYYPYKDTNTFTKEFLINKRNQLLRKYVPGPSGGSYMSTDKNYPTHIEKFGMNGRYSVELKGLWNLEGRGFMGGPFVSFTTLDKKRNRVVTVEGFVYAPADEKRNLVWEIESILYTLEIPENN